MNTKDHCAAEAREPSAVEKSIRNLECEISMLGNVVENVEISLNPILSSNDTKVAGTGADATKAECALVSVIDGEAGRLRMIRSRLESMLYRLQL